MMNGGNSALTPGASSRRAWIAAAIASVAVVVLFIVQDTLAHHIQAPLTREDGDVEWIGALGFFAGSIIMFLSFLQVRKDPSRRVMAYFLLACSIFLFLGGGEEISWGQRLFGWGTPHELAKENVQGETNLHNLAFIDKLDPFRAVMAAWYAYVIALPLLAMGFFPRLLPRVRRWLTTSLPVPAIALGIVYLTNDVMAMVIGRLNRPEVARFGSLRDQPRVELREAVFEVLTAVTAFGIYRMLRRRPPEEEIIAQMESDVASSLRTAKPSPTTQAL